MRVKLYHIFVLISLAVAYALTISCSGGDSGESDVPVGPDPDPVQVSSHYPKSAGSFRIVSYNVGNFGKYISNMNQNIWLVADLLSELEADAVGLNELDSVNTRHAANQIQLLAEQMGGWQCFFGRAIKYKGGAYGNGVILPLTEKIEKKYNLSLPNTGNFEARAVAIVETEHYVMAVTHLDASTQENLMGQITAINNWAESTYDNYSKPVFLLGDMNAFPGSAGIKLLETVWETVSSNEPSADGNVEPKRCRDYVFHYRKSSPVEVVGAHTAMEFDSGDVTLASDHHPIYVDIKF